MNRVFILKDHRGMNTMTDSSSQNMSLSATVPLPFSLKLFPLIVPTQLFFAPQ